LGIIELLAEHVLHELCITENDAMTAKIALAASNEFKEGQLIKASCWTCMKWL